MVMVLKFSEIGKTPKNGSEVRISRVGSVQDPQDPSRTAPDDCIPQRVVRGAPEWRQRPGIDFRVATGSIETIFSQFGDHRRFSDARTGRFSMVHPVQDISQNGPKTAKNSQFSQKSTIFKIRALLSSASCIRTLLVTSRGKKSPPIEL